MMYVLILQHYFYTMLPITKVSMQRERALQIKWEDAIVMVVKSIPANDEVEASPPPLHTKTSGPDSGLGYITATSLALMGWYPYMRAEFRPDSCVQRKHRHQVTYWC